MKKSRDTKLLFMLVAGFLLLIIPLLFFYNLLQNHLYLTEKSGMAMLREKLIVKAESIKNKLEPKSYIENAIREVHKKLLPEVTEKILEQTPESGFGKNIFTQKLANQMANELQKYGIKAILVTVVKPQSSSMEKTLKTTEEDIKPTSNNPFYYWVSPEIIKLDKDNPIKYPEKDLTKNFTDKESKELLAFESYRELIANSLRMYKLNYPEKNANFSINYAKNEPKIPHFYLDRSEILESNHDSVNTFFTDYYGPQFLFHYKYICISEEGFHGGYSLALLQEGIKPESIIEKACSSDTNIKIQITKSEIPKTSFIEKENRLNYYEQLPNQFLNHVSFYDQQSKGSGKTDISEKIIHLSADIPEKIIKLKRQISTIVNLGKLLLLLYCIVAFCHWNWNLSLQISIRGKLVAILSSLVVLPAISIGILTTLGLSSSDRIMENHILNQTQVMIKKFENFDSENYQRKQLALINLKNKLSSSYIGDTIYTLQKKQLSVRDTDAKEIINSMIIGVEGEKIKKYHRSLESKSGMDSNYSFIAKYMKSLGLKAYLGETSKEIKKQKIKNDVMQTAIETLLTSKEEEKIIREGMLIEDFTVPYHLLGRSAILTIKMYDGKWTLVNVILEAESHNSYKYLNKLNESGYHIFSLTDPYCDINVGLRPHWTDGLSMQIWPTKPAKNRIFQASHLKGFKTMDSGKNIIRNKNEIEITNWSKKRDRPLIISAIGKSKNIEAGKYAIFMLFPILAGYSILLILLLSRIATEFITKPIEVFESGIRELKQENYGVIIEKFSKDEFYKIIDAFNQMSVTLKQREMIKRFVPSLLIEKIKRNENDKNEKVTVSILSSDIRHFTTICEENSPIEIVELLNDYFTIMEEAIVKNSGTIDKYIGDAIQAIFYESPDKGNTAKRACKAAIEMRKRLSEFNKERKEKQLFTIENGIGIASGTVISGNIGNKTGRKDFTVIGSLTEDAAKLEANTVKTKSKIAVCNSTYKKCSSSFKFSNNDDKIWELENAEKQK